MSRAEGLQPSCIRRTLAARQTATFLKCPTTFPKSRGGLPHRGLDALFKHTPPTALIISEAMLFAAAQQHLARRGIVAPENISLICDDPDPTFAWYEPAISHFKWDVEPLLRSVVRWAQQVARGKRPHSKTFSVAEFVEGGTIGLAVER